MSTFYPRNTPLELRIKDCKKENRNWNYSRIARFIGCARSTVRYVVDRAVKTRIKKKYNLRYPKYGIK